MDGTGRGGGERTRVRVQVGILNSGEGVMGLGGIVGMAFLAGEWKKGVGSRYLASGRRCFKSETSVF